MKFIPGKCSPRVRGQMRTTLSAILFPGFIFLFSVLSTKAEINVQTGERLYKQYCTSCHRIDVKLMGPALRDVDKRRPDDWLIQWIRNNQALRAQGDEQALALFKGYNMEMPSFPLFTDDEIRSILVYIDQQPVANSAMTPADAAPFSRLFLLYGVMAVLFIAILVLIRLNYLLLHQLKMFTGQPLQERQKLRDLLTSKKFIAFIILVLVFLITFVTTESMSRLGYSKNYEPPQPIAFSHRIHAGIAQIDCRYCHSGVEKSKTAGIPSLNTCMNCHRGIREGEDAFQTAEIQKVISYYNSNQPVVWTKIQNLPDFVYFNHSQHVTVGLIDCETCHGPVDQMDQTYQFASLSMGWCVNCHRTSDVMVADNGFYRMYSKMQSQIRHTTGLLKDSGNVHITEEMMGGTECQRCHY